MSAALVAAALLGAAVLVAVPARTSARGLPTGRDALGPGDVPARGARSLDVPMTGELALVAVGVMLAALVVPVPPLVLLAAALAGLVVVRLRAAGRAERRRAMARQGAVDACEALVGELRAGRPLAAAAEGAAQAWSVLGPVAVRARLGGDVPAALREVAEQAGAGSLRQVAGAWQLCSTTGTGLVHALEQVLQTVRAEQDADRQVRTELAATRATSRMVAALPLVVLLAAQGAGARPWRVLLHTLPGQVCLVLGIGLVGLGLLWVEHIARSAVEDR